METSIRTDEDFDDFVEELSSKLAAIAPPMSSAQIAANAKQTTRDKAKALAARRKTRMLTCVCAAVLSAIAIYCWKAEDKPREKFGAKAGGGTGAANNEPGKSEQTTVSPPTQRQSENMTIPTPPVQIAGGAPVTQVFPQMSVAPGGGGAVFPPVQPQTLPPTVPQEPQPRPSPQPPQPQPQPSPQPPPPQPQPQPTPVPLPTPAAEPEKSPAVNLPVGDNTGAADEKGVPLEVIWPAKEVEFIAVARKMKLQVFIARREEKSRGEVTLLNSVRIRDDGTYTYTAASSTEGLARIVLNTRLREMRPAEVVAVRLPEDVVKKFEEFIAGQLRGKGLKTAKKIVARMNPKTYELELVEIDAAPPPSGNATTQPAKQPTTKKSK